MASSHADMIRTAAHEANTRLYPHLRFQNGNVHPHMDMIRDQEAGVGIQLP